MTFTALLFLSEDSGGRNTVQTEPSHPVIKVALNTFGRTFVKFVVSAVDQDPDVLLN